MEIYGLGRNGSNHYLGIFDNLREANIPTRVAALEKLNITKISTNSDSAYALASNGDLYSWGNNSFGQLGLGTKIVDTQLRDRPYKVNNLPPVRDFVCASCSVVCITVNEGCWTWGNNERGAKLGLGVLGARKKFFSTPVQIPDLAKKNIEKIVGTEHGVFLAKTVQGELYVWGRNKQGNLCLGHKSTVSQPILFPFQRDAVQIISSSSDSQHSIVKMHSGMVYEMSFDSPKKIPFDDEISYIGTGVNWSVFITTHGEAHLYTASPNASLKPLPLSCKIQQAVVSLCNLLLAVTVDNRLLCYDMDAQQEEPSMTSFFVEQKKRVTKLQASICQNFIFAEYFPLFTRFPGPGLADVVVMAGGPTAR